MRICLIYDCLFPHTVGGAERWYRNLAEALRDEGHEVTYVTLRQWERGSPPEIPGVAVRAVGGRLALYSDGGRRRILPPLIFGLGVFVHLLRHGRRYDVVHTASFPYFSVLAAAALKRVKGFRLVVDWWEVWTRQYWRAYLGDGAGQIGWQVQRLCARVDHHAFCFSRLHAERLREVGFRGQLQTLRGAYSGTRTAVPDLEPDPLVVFAGRHIAEKRVQAVIPAIALARESIPGLRAEIYGDGPERDAVLAAIRQYALEGVVSAPGFVDAPMVEGALARAMCLLLPSRREGYGLVVVEAAAHGTPSVLVADADNAAVEFIATGENGYVAASASAADLADALLRVHAAGRELRMRTSQWFLANANELSLSGSLATVLQSYQRLEVTG